MFQNERHLVIEWGDCDPASIVFYPRYFAFFDASTSALFAALGYSLKRIRDEMNDIGYPMVDTRSQFYQTSCYGDLVTIKSDITSVGTASFEVRHRLFKDDGSLAVECAGTRVWTTLADNGKLKSKPIPASIRQKMLDEKEPNMTDSQRH